MNPLKSVLFDHDGTLVNSEGIHYAIWCQTLLPLGVNLSEVEYKAHFVGIPSTHSAVDVVRRHGLPMLPQELTRQKESLTHDYLRQQAFPLMPGAHDAVASLAYALRACAWAWSPALARTALKPLCVPTAGTAVLTPW
jgi:beta-phosphoglucomutase-like phosphatase (HAD superfamily)